MVESIWRKFGQANVDVFASQEMTHSLLWFSLKQPPLGLDALVQTWWRQRLYAFPLIALLPGVVERVHQCPSTSGSPVLAALSMTSVLLVGLPWEIPVRRDFVLQTGDTTYHSWLEMWKLLVWPLRGISL